MNRTLTIAGFILSFGYLAAVVYLFGWEFAQIRNLKPNEVGDFLTGVFGPLAIIWLILGFLQQGIELRQNTEALTLQVEELHNSAREQRALVSTTREQLKAEREHLELKRQEFEQTLVPRFLFTGLGSTTRPSGVTYQVHIRNVGAIGSYVQLLATPPFAEISLPDISVFLPAQEYSLEFRFQSGHPRPEDRLVLTYRDAAGRAGQASFAFLLNGEGTFCEIVRNER